MKKNIKRLRSGFSVAELLISMLIAMIIAAALVPVIGPKRVQRPSNRLNHGIAECFYDENGALTYFYADNDPNSETIRETVPSGQNYCTFTAPNADYFEMIAIGAGGQGNQTIYDDTYYEISSASATGSDASSSGTISLDNNFQTSIANSQFLRYTDADGNITTKINVSIPQAIKSIITNWNGDDSGIRVPFNLESPLGKGGDGKCKVYQSTNHPCDCSILANSDVCPGPLRPSNSDDHFFDINNLNWDNKCWLFIHGKGGDSGKGKRTKDAVNFMIKGTSNIQLTQSASEAKVEVDGNYVKLSASGNGGDAVWNGGNFKYDWTNGTDSACSASTAYSYVCNREFYDIQAKNGAPYGTESEYQCGANRGESGSVGNVSTPYSLRWEKNEGVIKAWKMGEKGGYGNEKSLVYEKLTGIFHLYPAADNDSVSYVVRHDADTSDESLISAQSGANGGTYSDYFNIDLSTLPMVASIKDKAVSKNESHFLYIYKVKTAMSKVNNSGIGTTLADCNTNGRDFCPGFAGGGIYSFLTFDTNDEGHYDIPEMSKVTVYLNTGSAETSRSLPFSSATNVSSSISTCLDGSSPIGDVVKTYDDKNYYPKYCKDARQRGSRGAVIIIW